jgi:acyl-ACP thioesterase
VTVGRRFETSRRVRLADADPSGRLRLDALARFLQDIGNDDTADAGHDATAPWVTRRTTVNVVGGWPRIGERLEVTTWCGGLGSHFAERRTDLVSPSGRIEAAATWVHLDASGRPARLPQWFHDSYASAAEGRKITARLHHPPLPSEVAEVVRWPLRYADLDVVGHVNNAAYWEAVEEVCHRRALVPTFAEVEYAGGIDAGDAVELHLAGENVWLVVDGTVRGSAVVR